MIIALSCYALYLTYWGSTVKFVCEPCKTAGKLIGVDLTPIAPLQRELHQQCKGGTWCDCQHRTEAK